MEVPWTGLGHHCPYGWSSTWWRQQMETFPRYWPFVWGIHRRPVNSPHKGQWRGALMVSLICVWINNWVNNREAGDLRRHRGHYDVCYDVCLHTNITFIFGRCRRNLAVETHEKYECHAKDVRDICSETNMSPGDKITNRNLITPTTGLCLLRFVMLTCQIYALPDAETHKHV